MIDKKTKTKLLSELEKRGNVWFACAKVGISRATYYRWCEEDKNFREKAHALLKQGRENMCDIAEHALAIKVKEGSIEAIKYQLSHNSPFYKPRTVNKVILEHRRTMQSTDTLPSLTLEDILDKWQVEVPDIETLETQPAKPAPNAVGTVIVLPEES